MELWTDWPGFATLQHKLDALADPPMEAILLGLEQVVFTDNRDGLLAATDRDGQPMPRTVRESLDEGHEVFYRLPDDSIGHYWQAGRHGDHPEDGPGPPLAPHGLKSRSITNLATGHYEDGPGAWVVFGAWEDVLSEEGVPFLPFHFRGEGKLPTRDLAGLRPDGRARALALVDDWASAVLAGQDWAGPVAG